MNPYFPSRLRIHPPAHTHPQPPAMSRAKSRNLQSTKNSLAVLLPSSTTAASDLVAALLPASGTGWGTGSAPRFSPGPTGGAVLRGAVTAPSSASGGGRESGGRSEGAGKKGRTPTAGGAAAGGPGGGAGSAGAASVPPPPAAAAADQSLLGVEAALEGLGLDPETLRLVGSAATAAGLGGAELGGGGVGLVGALTGLKEAEGRARAAAEVLEGLGEGSPVAGKVRG